MRRLRIWKRLTLRSLWRATTVGSEAGPLVEVLEFRVFLSAAYSVVPLTEQPAGADAAYTVPDNLVAGGTVLESQTPAYTVATGTLVPNDPTPITPGPGGHSGFHILLEEGPNLRANAAASAAFQQAVNFLESVFTTPTTIVIDAEIAPMASNIIGATSSVEYHLDSSQYDSMRTLLVDAAAGGDGIDYSLPTSSQFTAYVPPSATNPFTVGGLTATRANLLALGVAPSELQSGPNSLYNPKLKVDMTMTFNSKFNFDYTRGNGISAGKIDFTGVVEHEIAHGMGFDSEVDNVDYLLSHPSLSRVLYPTTMDLFRLTPGEGEANFSDGPRVLAPGDIISNQVFYDGGDFDPTGIQIPGLTTGDIPLSTGQYHGDGDQASHWLDSSTVGYSIGALNPTASYGQPVLWTQNDTRVLGLIGWLVSSRSSIQGTVYSTASHMIKSAASSSGGALTGNVGLPGVTVYLDENNDGIHEPWEPSVTSDGLGAYRFFDLTAGNYLVRTVPIDGVAPTPVSPASAMVPLGLNATVAGPNFKLASAELPSLWDGTDIGAVAGPGSDSYASGDFTLTSQGNDVYGISDAAHYVYQSVSGNFTITAQVSDFGAADQWAKAGLMVRPDLYAKSANVFIAQTYRHGAQLLTRTKAGAHTQVTANPATSEPWLKLVRRGNTFTAYASADDIHWQFLGQSVVTLPKTVDVGLALTARNPSLASTAVFSEVQITG